MISGKKVISLSINNSGKEVLHNYLYAIFSDYIDLESYLIDTVDEKIVEDAQLIILSSAQTFYRRPEIFKNNNYVICNRTVNYNNIVDIFNIEPDTKVYVVNDTELSTKETIMQLKEIGVTHIELIPFHFGSLHNDKSVTTAISVGEDKLVPKDIQNIVNIGSRIIDISSLSEIISRIGLPIDIISEITTKFLKDFINIIKISNQQLHSINKTQQILKNTFNNISNGICVINENGIIQMANNKFVEMLGLLDKNLVKKNIYDMFNELKIDYTQEDMHGDDKIITNQLGIDIIISSYKIVINAEKLYIIYANYTDDIYKKEISIRKSIDKTRSFIKYKFEDYITKDEYMLDMLSKAKLIANSDSCVLIQGESGTGKEIIAQSIHYASARKNHPFVAMNFAAIQPSLLESELFGYEEGAFTGAKKGGKKGLLEMAHKGTIFFDEIGDAPISSQIALLRVLQESEIRRVGGTENIPIDVRVIVATNKNLLEKVNDGSFRQDLFYRINVMPIDTSPIRERKDDIVEIFNTCLKNKFNDFNITIDDICTKDLKLKLINYSWPGNVREIVNLCEYFSCIKTSNKLSLIDLPKYIFKYHGEDKITVTSLEKEVLSVIKEHPKIGRNKILEMLNSNDIKITDGKVRGLLTELGDKKLIKVNKTKGGCEITGIGESFL